MIDRLCCDDPNCPHHLSHDELLELWERERVQAIETLDRLWACDRSRPVVIWAKKGIRDRPWDMVPPEHRDPEIYDEIKRLLQISERKPLKRRRKNGC